MLQLTHGPDPRCNKLLLFTELKFSPQNFSLSLMCSPLQPSPGGCGSWQLGTLAACPGAMSASRHGGHGPCRDPGCALWDAYGVCSVTGTDSPVRCQIPWTAWGQDQPGPRARDLMAIILCLVVQRQLRPARKLRWELWCMEEVGPAAAQPAAVQPSSYSACEEAAMTTCSEAT